MRALQGRRPSHVAPCTAPTPLHGVFLSCKKWDPLQMRSFTRSLAGECAKRATNYGQEQLGRDLATRADGKEDQDLLPFVTCRSSVCVAARVLVCVERRLHCLDDLHHGVGIDLASRTDEHFVRLGPSGRVGWPRSGHANEGHSLNVQFRGIVSRTSTGCHTRVRGAWLRAARHRALQIRS
jgi:hypothetical protein